MTNKLLLSYYGDDFTGSTDVLEAMTLGGIKSVLFLTTPEPDWLDEERFAGVQVVGIAGISRAISPKEMEVELRPKLAALKQLEAPICHYKTCSTFDSSPTVGSIGRAADIGAEIFQSDFVPMVVGAPALRRYLIFGNLFATVDEITYRLDRHPTMSKHPVTPMDEADLQLHLAKQTEKPITLFDTLQLAGSPEKVQGRFQALLETKPEVVLFDTLDQDHLVKVGGLIWENRGDKPLYVVGSSGFEYALSAYWRSIKFGPEPAPLVSPGPVEQIVVVSGSASPVTAEQINWAINQGFAAIHLDSIKLVDPDLAGAEAARVTQIALQALGQGQSVVLYSAYGPDDPSLAATNERLRELDLTSRELGQRQGQIMRTLLAETGIRRACVAGGDTSSYAAPQLGIYALQMIVPTAPGSPLCRASSRDATFDGLEIALKGGQVGKADYFGIIRQGGVLPN